MMMFSKKNACGVGEFSYEVINVTNKKKWPRKLIEKFKGCDGIKKPLLADI